MAHEHSHKPCLAVGFLLILQYGIDKQRKVFCRHARQLEGHFRALKGNPDNLVGWIASVVQLLRFLSSLQVTGAFVLVFFRRGFLREGILSGNQGQGGTVVPLNSNRAHIVHIGNRALGTGRRGLRIIHGMQGDAGSGRVLPPQKFNLFPCKPLVQMIISFFGYPDFGLYFAVLLFPVVPAAVVLPSVPPAGASPSLSNGFRYSGTAWLYAAAFSAAL